MPTNVKNIMQQHLMLTNFETNFSQCLQLLRHVDTFQPILFSTFSIPIIIIRVRKRVKPSLEVFLAMPNLPHFQAVYLPQKKKVCS